MIECISMLWYRYAVLIMNVADYEYLPLIVNG